jgi:hypothetical protein
MTARPRIAGIGSSGQAGVVFVGLLHPSARREQLPNKSNARDTCLPAADGGDQTESGKGESGLYLTDVNVIPDGPKFR